LDLLLHKESSDSGAIKTAIRINKAAEKERKESLFSALSVCDDISTEAETQRFGDLVGTQYVLEKARAMIRQMEQNVFRSFVIQGPSGSGKMAMLSVVD
jgi:replication-associated recombination protein RarA